MCIPNFHKLTGSLISLKLFFASFISHYLQRQDGQPKKHLCVRVCVSINPFCQASTQPFLSKLPAWSRSLLCWGEKLEEKACGTPAAPRPGLCGRRSRGWAWDLVHAGALCGSCDWRFNRFSLGHPGATPHSLSHLGNGGEKTITHIFSSLLLPVCPQSCIADV